MEGDRVCVGGFLEDGQVVRPVYRGGPTESWLRPAAGVEIVPFAIVDLMVQRRPKPLVPPHIEDRLIPVRGHRVTGMLSQPEQMDWLASSRSSSVRAIFGATVHSDATGPWGRFVQAGDGSRSLGTIEAAAISDVRYAHYPERNRWDYRIRFTDGTREEYQLAIVDLAFRKRLNEMRHAGYDPGQAAGGMLDVLQQQIVYLRIGLARGWDRHPDRCYLQITGVYGFAR